MIRKPIITTGDVSISSNSFIIWENKVGLENLSNLLIRMLNTIDIPYVIDPIDIVAKVYSEVYSVGLLS